MAVSNIAKFVFTGLLGACLQQASECVRWQPYFWTGDTG